MATATVASFETQHEDMIHDAQADYYGRRLATASSDKSVRIFQLAKSDLLDHADPSDPTTASKDAQPSTLLATLLGHDGPVWQVAWAHPKYGNILASCGYDRSVIVWKEIDAPGPSQASAGLAKGPTSSTWVKIYQYSAHDLSVNSLAWAPHEFGLVLACGSSDGTVSILSWQGTGGSGNDPASAWGVRRFAAHSLGVNAVSWGPLISSNHPYGSTSLVVPTAPAGGSADVVSVRLVTGGSDSLIKIWAPSPNIKSSTTQPQSAAASEWSLETELKGHEDWVRDVAWAPSIGLPAQTLASASQARSLPPCLPKGLTIACTQDGVVFVWTQEGPGKAWTRKSLDPKFPDSVWRLSWSLVGNILAVTSGDNKVTLWKESLDHTWKCITQLDAS